jgi:hypothetical protein
VTRFCEQNSLNAGNIFTGKSLHNEAGSLPMTNEEWAKKHDQAGLYQPLQHLCTLPRRDRFEASKNCLTVRYEIEV